MSMHIKVSLVECGCRELLAQWRSYGGKIQLVDNKLKVTPKRAITPKVRRYITRHAGVFKALLRLEEAISEVPFEPDGYVYVLAAGPHYKIGRATNIDRRLKQLKIQLPFEAKLIHSIRCENHAESERYWHERLHQYRCNGEWFALDGDVLEDLLSHQAMRGEEKLW